MIHEMKKLGTTVSSVKAESIVKSSILDQITSIASKDDEENDEKKSPLCEQTNCLNQVE
jgi:hypothetical protein